MAAIRTMKCKGDPWRELQWGKISGQAATMVIQPTPSLPPKPSSKQGGEREPHPLTRAGEARFKERTRLQ